MKERVFIGTFGQRVSGGECQHNFMNGINTLKKKKGTKHQRTFLKSKHLIGPCC